MGLIESRMSSFVDRGNKLIQKGKKKEAIKLVERGMQYYSERVIGAVSPFSKADAGLIVLVLRHIADEVEKNNPYAKEFYEGMKKCVSNPTLEEIEKIRNANRR